MKIAHITMFYEPAICGVKQVVRELAERQVKDGHDVHIFCCNSDKEKRLKVCDANINGVKVHYLPYWFKLSRFTFIWPSLYWKFPKDKFDIIHSHVSGHLYVYIAGLLARKNGIPHIHTTHCPWTDAFRPLPARIALFFSYNFFNRGAFKRIDKVVAITPWEISFIKRWAPESKISVIPNGMADVMFERVNPNNFKKEHKIDGKLVLFFGRLNVTKGVDKLALVAKDVVKERKDVWFMWVGPDEGMQSTVEEIIKGEPRLILHEPIRDRKKVAEMYQAADVYTLPSFREGLPLTLFEAMAAGLPIVASPVNGVPYEMKEPENGFLVNYGDLENLKKRILQVLDDKKLAHTISRNNIDRSKQYNWDIIAKRYMSTYQEALKR
jgi:glycosyltransferase involved in cell wall biosynthesis